MWNWLCQAETRAHDCARHKNNLQTSITSASAECVCLSVSSKSSQWWKNLFFSLKSGRIMQIVSVLFEVYLEISAHNNGGKFSILSSQFWKLLCYFEWFTEQTLICFKQVQSVFPCITCLAFPVLLCPILNNWSFWQFFPLKSPFCSEEHYLLWMSQNTFEKPSKNSLIKMKMLFQRACSLPLALNTTMHCFVCVNSIRRHYSCHRWCNVMIVNNLYQLLIME